MYYLYVIKVKLLFFFCDRLIKIANKCINLHAKLLSIADKIITIQERKLGLMDYWY